MEIETLFTEQKWNILRLLARESLSPLQLAQKSNTTMANISQQLRLLEASSLVGKRKIPNRDKGKPRSLYHLSKDFAYLIQVSDGFADKKFMELEPLQKAMYTIWFLHDKKLHYFLEKWVWKIESQLPNIQSIIVIEKMIKEGNNTIPVFIVSAKATELKKKIGSLEIKDNHGTVKTIKAECIDAQQFPHYVRNKKALFDRDVNPLILYDTHQKALHAIRDIDKTRTQ